MSRTPRPEGAGLNKEVEPDELGPQIGAIRGILEAWGVPVVGVRNFEADDVAGTLAQAASEAGRSTVVVTGDRDFVQLVGGTVQVLMTVKGGAKPSRGPLSSPVTKRSVARRSSSLNASRMAAQNQTTCGLSSA